MFTLTNLLPGDAALDVGTVPRGGTLTVDFLSQDVFDARDAGQITIAPAVFSPTAPSSLVNSIAAYAGSYIVDPTSATLSRANDALLAGRLIALENAVYSLAQFVFSRVKAGE